MLQYVMGCPEADPTQLRDAITAHPTPQQALKQCSADVLRRYVCAESQDATARCPPQRSFQCKEVLYYDCLRNRSAVKQEMISRKISNWEPNLSPLAYTLGMRIYYVHSAGHSRYVKCPAVLASLETLVQKPTPL